MNFIYRGNFLFWIAFYVLSLQSVHATFDGRHKQESFSNKFVNLASRGDTIAMANMLKSGVDINSTNNQGVTAVLAATMNNNVTTLKWLIAGGANIDHFDPSNKPIDYTPFLYAGAYGFDDILDLLIPLKPNVKLLNGYGGSALIPACEKGHLSTVKKLLEQTEIDVNLVNNSGWTALLEAIVLGKDEKKQEKIVELLLNSGADYKIVDSKGITPLEHAYKRNFKGIVKLLEKQIQVKQK
jgi:hypothetical protein